jgi:hypothetical protein
MVDKYDFDVESEGGCDMCGAIAEKCNTGDYVLYDDYAKLQAENEDLQNNFDEATSIICRLEAENKALRDLLKKAYKGFSDDNPDLAFELLDDNRDLIL